MTAVKTDGGFKPSPATPDEKEKVVQIMEIMFGQCDEDKALTFLRRNGGNVDKTITALFDVPNDDAPTTSGTTELSDLRAAASSVVLSQKPWPPQGELTCSRSFTQPQSMLRIQHPPKPTQPQ